MFQSVESGLSEELVHRFAPTLQFHPQERWFPTSMEKTFAHFQKNGKLHHAQIDYNAPQYEPVIISQVKQDSVSKRYYIQYWFYYTWNGSQCFHITQATEEGSLKYNEIWFEWSPIAEHQSDFETVTLEVNPNGQFIERLMVFSHGESIWRRYPSNSSIRPYLYVALNSHAMYLKEKDFSFIDKSKFFDQQVPKLMQWVSGGQNKKLDILDVVDSKHYVITSSRHPPKDTDGPLKPLIMDIRNEKILIVNNNELDSEWMKWRGPWGQRTHQQKIRFPPEGVPDRYWYKLILWLAIKTTLANKFVRNVKAGISPWFRKEWMNVAQENPSDFKNYSNIVQDLGFEN